MTNPKRPDEPHIGHNLPDGHLPHPTAPDSKPKAQDQKHIVLSSHPRKGNVSAQVVLVVDS